MIDVQRAMPLLARYAGGEELSAADKRTAARYALQELAARHPGKSVEVRVPFVGAVQIVEGLHHRRGTPPNVVELAVEPFLDLVLGRLSWDAAIESGAVAASGTRASLAHYVPVFNRAALERWG